jgi:hypothetical protein
MCYECWPKKEFEDDGMNRANQRQCPVCRLIIECETCGRSCIKEKAPEYSCDVDDVGDVPLTVTETDLPYSPTCFECMWPRLQTDDGWWFKKRGRRRRDAEE